VDFRNLTATSPKPTSRLLATGTSYAIVLRALGDDNAKLEQRERVTIDSVRHHTLRHFPVKQVARATYRDILERLVAPNRVMSMAHVVAGTDSVLVEVDGTRYDAQVVSYDPNRDISILDVPNLRAQPLLFAEAVADSGTDALLLGYPGGGDFVATPVRIREVGELSGPDI
jgi:S1-C subfamily serine protease